MPESEAARRGESTRTNARRSGEFAHLDMMWVSIDAYLPNNATRIEIPEAQVTALTALKASWDVAYPVYLDPLQHTTAAVMAAETEYKKSMEAINAMQQFVKNNPNVELTDADYVALYIHKDKDHRTRTPVQEFPPNIVETTTKQRVNGFYTTYPDSGGNAHRALPYHNHLRIKVAFMAPGTETPPTEGDFHMVMDSTRNAFKVTAAPDVARGALGYVKCCYVNTHAEAGPESAPFQFVVT